MNQDKFIIALDLRNGTIENLEDWFIATDYVTSITTKNYLRQCVTTSQNNDETAKKIFMINDVVFATIDNYEAINFTEGLQKDLMENSIPIQLNEIEIYRSALIDYIFNCHRKNPKIALELSDFQNYNINNLFLNSDFVKCVTSIAVQELGLTLRDFFAPLNQKFKAILQEFKNHYRTDKYLNKIKLTRIFIIDGFIFGYSFRLENETAEHFFWNIYFEEHLLLIDCFTFNKQKIMSIDDVLDKINNIGLNNLTENDFEILKNS